MLDFTSSLYLGFRHARRSLRPWLQLTTGVPATLAEAPAAEAVAGRLAGLQGCEAAVLAPSTLHLFWDLLGMLGREGASVYVDAGVYPIARWGAERAAGLGAPVQKFPHHDAKTLERRLSESHDGRRVVVVADGVCAACGVALPVQRYLDLVRRAGGLLVLDDTQALGVLGSGPGHMSPYGKGGGGSLRFAGVQGVEIVLISSLAKGFGAPLAALSGTRKMVERFKAQSETRTHCSPPSLAAINAAQRALEMNAAHGEALRRRLARNVMTFRRLTVAAGLPAGRGLFPVQTLEPAPGVDARRIYPWLLKQGVRTVPRQGGPYGKPRLSFILTAQHTSQAIERAMHLLTIAARALRSPGFESTMPLLATP